MLVALEGVGFAEKPGGKMRESKRKREKEREGSMFTIYYLIMFPGDMLATNGNHSGLPRRPFILPKMKYHEL